MRIIIEVEGASHVPKVKTSEGEVVEPLGGDASGSDMDGGAAPGFVEGVEATSMEEVENRFDTFDTQGLNIQSAGAAPTLEPGFDGDPFALERDAEDFAPGRGL